MHAPVLRALRGIGGAAPAAARCALPRHSPLGNSGRCRACHGLPAPRAGRVAAAAAAPRLPRLSKLVVRSAQQQQQQRNTADASPPAPSPGGGASTSRLLVLNAGSSSLKFKAFTLGGDGRVSLTIGGVLERIGDPDHSVLSAKADADGTSPAAKWKLPVPAANHVAAMAAILDFLAEHVSPGMAAEVVAVGHRVVHGLDINQPVLLDEGVLATIEKAKVLAPLHNGAALQGIAAAGEVFKGTPQVAVFDTAFHATMPSEAYMYGLPYELYTEHHIRRYGFHGTSHSYLVEQAAGMLGKRRDEVNVITCHLGNGCSVAAVRGGRCVDTSMGMTPLEGLVMGTRCGDVDPAVVLHIQKELGLSVGDTDALLNKKSGLLGLCGDNDMRGVVSAADGGNERAQLALKMFVYRIRKYIGAYLAVLGGTADAIVFSAGIGENNMRVRAMVCDGLEPFSIALDAAANEAALGVQADVSAGGGRSRTRVLVIPTNEELSIAQQTLQVVSMHAKS